MQTSNWWLQSTCRARASIDIMRTEADQFAMVRARRPHWFLTVVAMLCMAMGPLASSLCTAAAAGTLATDPYFDVPICHSPAAAVADATGTPDAPNPAPKSNCLACLAHAAVAPLLLPAVPAYVAADRLEAPLLAAETLSRPFLKLGGIGSRAPPAFA